MNFSIRRWKWAYFGLAFLSFLGFCAILFLNHQLQTQDIDSVRVNKFFIGKPIQIPSLIEVLKRCPGSKANRKVS